MRRFPSPFACGLVVLAASALSATGTQAQQGVRSLPAPDKTFEEPFSSIGAGALYEKADGRVIVADPRDKIISLVDLLRGSSQSIGREGSGPGEFGMPLRVFGAPGDTAFVFDPLNSRYLVIAPDGKPSDSFRVEIESGSSAPGGIRIGGMSMARTSDARGRLYTEAPSITMGPNGPQGADSTALVRYDRGTKRLDTLGYVAVVKPEVSGGGGGGGGNVSIRIGGGNPLSPRDEWAVFPDGRVGIVRHNPFRVEFVMPDGKKVSPAPFRYTPVRMTAADRREEERLREVTRQNSMMMSVTNENGRTSRSAQIGPGANAPPLPPLDNWPEFKPPFRPGQASVWARPNGELWIRRLEAAGAKGTLYDVVNPAGAVIMQVRLPEGVTLVGFGKNTVYTTTTDEDGLVYLRRHTIGETPLRG
ncbi:MAG: hypothetical protein KF709_08055 [Gemmatimonadaceae bacterium]|nr:hypothetical protein [Gemmatimonadaceae bacterium]